MAIINFVRDRQKKLTKQQTNDKQIMLLALGIFGVGSIFGLSSLGLKIYFSTQLKNSLAEIETVKSQILAGEETESTFVILIHKLKAMSEVMRVRQKKQTAVDYFSQIFGSQVLIEEMSFAQDKETQLLTFKLLSPTVFVLEAVLQQLSSPELRQKYPEIETGSLERTENGAYSLHLAVKL